MERKAHCGLLDYGALKSLSGVSRIWGAPGVCVSLWDTVGGIIARGRVSVVARVLDTRRAGC